MTQRPDLSMFSKEEIKETLNEIRHDFSVAIFGTDNYFNGGAIVRTAHQFLVKEIILVDCPKIYEKATMGTHKWENIIHLTMADFLQRFLPTQNVILFERRPDLASESLVDYEFPSNPVFCFGNEKTGIPDELIQAAAKSKQENPSTGHVVSIPQFGIQNDLNLACAAGIVMYDWVAKKYRSNQ